MYSEDEQKEIEEAFFKSWDEAEHFYNLDLFTLELAWVRNILPLIKILRERGYDRRLGAESSGMRLRLSRSREPMLRSHQPTLDLFILEEGGMSVKFWCAGAKVELDFDRFEVTPELENLLIPLLAYPIDYGEG
jgi:hypothetical protein